jgi:tetratricopeptide (TPR) repeat protein/4-amino-4-deoxy-L-arabinose transferase-like glycosyltransferase
MAKPPKKRATTLPKPQGDFPAADGAAASRWPVEPRHVLWGILLIGALLRVIYLVSIADNPDFRLPAADAAYKDFWARAILTGNAEPAPGQPDPQLATSPYVRPPGYPYFLAIVYLLTGYSYTAVRLIQMAVGLLSCWLLYRLGRRVFAEPIALLSAFLMSTYWAFILFEAELNSPALIVALVLGILNLMLDWAEAPRPRTLAWAGLLFGLLVLDRPETLLFLPVLLLWAVLAGPVQLPWAKRALQVALIPLIVVLCIAPITLRNYVRSGEFVPICTIGGLNFYAGNNPEATGYFPNIDFHALFGVAQGLSHHNFPQLVAGLERKTGQEGLTQSDLEDYFVSEALRFIRENPGQTLLLWLKKAAYFWGPHEISSDKVFEVEKRESALLRILPPFWLFMCLAATGVVMLALRRRVPVFRTWVQEGSWRPLSLIACFVAVCFVTHLIFFVVARFRMPVIPFVLLLAAFAMAHGASFLFRRDSTMVGFWLGVMAVAVAVFAIPWAPYKADAVMHHYQRGVLYGHLGDTSEAIREFKRAIAEGGDRSAPVCSELGFGLSLQGELDNALFWYDKALAADPNHVATLFRKGEILLLRNEFAGASACFRTAVEADFTHVPSRLGLVRSLVQQDQMVEAEKIARDTADLGLGAYEGHVMLGEITSRRGQYAEALQHYQRAAELRPNDADIHNLIGLQLAALGRYEEAIASYQHAIQLRPGFALAYTNMGNLYAHLGDYDRAIIQYTDALTANPLEPGAEYGWAYVNEKRGDMEKAIFRAGLAVQKRPAYTEGHNYLGYLLMQTGKLEQARYHLERAVFLNGRYIQARNNLGDLYARLGLPADAEKQYRAVLELSPNEPYAKAQLAKLKSAPAPAPVQQPQIKQQQDGQKVLVFPAS